MSEITAAAADMDRLLRLAAHDLRGPLFGLLGLTELLAMTADEAPRDRLTEQARLAHAAAMQLADLADALFLQLRASAGGLEPIHAPVDLEALTERVLALYGPSCDAKSVTLEGPVNAGALPRVEGDPFLLEAILRNLIANAVKFSPPGTTVSLSVSAQPDAVVMMVQDEAGGIDPQVIANASAGRTVSARIGTGGEAGSGQGMRLAFQLCEKLGLTLTYLPAGKGTRAQLSIPLHRPG
ncbi:sensor histidine kinase [Radicibacter daui]|uniref:sensor histidine kinase n=1 Tax=Radicibacter daui TaxID=3064829 RepID=UPI004046E729